MICPFVSFLCNPFVLALIKQHGELIAVPPSLLIITVELLTYVSSVEVNEIDDSAVEILLFLD